MAKKTRVTGATVSRFSRKEAQWPKTTGTAYSAGKKAGINKVGMAMSVDKAAGYPSTYQNPGPAASGAGLMKKGRVTSVQYNMPTAKLIMSNNKR